MGARPGGSSALLPALRIPSRHFPGAQDSLVETGALRLLRINGLERVVSFWTVANRSRRKRFRTVRSLRAPVQNSESPDAQAFSGGFPPGRPKLMRGKIEHVSGRVCVRFWLSRAVGLGRPFRTLAFPSRSFFPESRLASPWWSSGATVACRPTLCLARGTRPPSFEDYRSVQVATSGRRR